MNKNKNKVAVGNTILCYYEALANVISSMHRTRF